jgi:hypothetical protein
MRYLKGKLALDINFLAVHFIKFKNQLCEILTVSIAWMMILIEATAS